MANILIFYSGVGGLSIAAVIDKHMPEHRLVFSSDNAAYPYGTKTIEELVPRVVKVVEKLIYSIDIDIVIIACNTASTVALPELRKRLSIDVVGVVPAIKPAAKISKTKRIGILATPATIKRQYTHDLVNDFAADCEVEMLGSAELVDVAERKLHRGEVSSVELEMILKPWLLDECQIDTIVLACTHFPLLKAELDSMFKKNNKSIQWIDSSEGIAKRIQFLLKKTDHGKYVKPNSLKNNCAVFTAKPTVSAAFRQHLCQVNMVNVMHLNV